MASDLFPLSPSESYATCKPRWRRSFLLSRRTIKIGFFSTAAFFLTSLIVYGIFFFPSRHSSLWGLSDWHFPSRFDLDSLLVVDPKVATLVQRPLPLPFPPPASRADDLTLEQIRDIVAPTRGFFSRDYSLRLGWNNVRYIFEAALLQAQLLNRTLVLPSFVYARACEYDIKVCADYATMVNKGDAINTDEWRNMPIEKQIGFRIPISIIVNITHLRNRQPVITASEYLRLHGQDPESETSSGFWSRQPYPYHSHPNVFETNKMKIPSLFVIENHWYEPEGTNRVDYIPEAMKRRGNLERSPGPGHYDGHAQYWPPSELSELSDRLVAALPKGHSRMDWITAKKVLVNSIDLVLGDGNMDDDQVVEELLNSHGWEVLHTFPAVVGEDTAKIVVGHLKEVVQRSSIRGFRENYLGVDADVVVLAGETHRGTKPGAMRFTEELSRKRFASTVVHSLIPPQKVIDFAEVLSSRMRWLTKGRAWMGAHLRRGDFKRLGWVMETNPEDHIQRVKNRLQAGRIILIDLQERGHWRTTDDIEGVQLDPEQTILPTPEDEDLFFIATDERDPDACREIAAAGGVFISDLITMEDRRTYGWTLMVTDLIAVVEQQLLVRSSFFYGNYMSSFAGAIVNMRAGRGADPRTMLLD